MTETSGEYDTTVAAGKNEDAAGMPGAATGAEAGKEPSGSQGHGHGGGMAGDGAALPPGRHPRSTGTANHTDTKPRDAFGTSLHLVH